MKTSPHILLCFVTIVGSLIVGLHFIGDNIMRSTALTSTIFLFITSLLSFFLVNRNMPINAAGNLEDMKDVVASMIPTLAGVGHAIGFTLPRNSMPILHSDYIIIGMDKYENISANIVVKGAYAGTPAFIIDGHNVKITGINVLPGNAITIEGISADNPTTESLMKIVITITEDTEGNLIKNVGTVYSSRSSGNIAVTATIAPPYASVRISGYSAPGTFITVTENGTVIGTDTVGIGGLFSKYLTGIFPGSHTFTVYGVDQSSRTTSLLDVSAITPIYQETSISNLLLSPTIEINSTEVNQGNDLLSWGSSIIEGNLSIFTEPHLRTYYTSASSAGLWSYTINNTDEYIPGDYHIYSLVQNASGSQSLFSNALQFSVISQTGGGNAPCDISRGDLSCDGSVNLLDFSILMYYWGSSNTAADINSDSFVNLVDFSIMMYYWGT